MIIKPKTRGFICLTAHPVGCERNVAEQIAYVNRSGTIDGGPKNVLIIGASTGYGLASRIVASFGCGANTVGVFFERLADGDKPASAGWYNSTALKKYAEKEGLIAENINGDAFSDEVKEKTIEAIKSKLGQVDCVVYSLASPKRTDPRTGETYRSVLKPIGGKFKSKTVNVDSGEIGDVEIESATAEEIVGTVKVMGGEDWELWMQTLLRENVLSDRAKTVAYSYLGPKITKPIYSEGTIGRAKEDLDRAADAITHMLANIGGRAHISVNKAVVTQASSAIPVVPLYIAILFRVMREKNLHEGCIEQMYRLFKNHLYGSDESVDTDGRIRIDNLEMREDVQEAVIEIWNKASTENLRGITDIDAYRKEFLKLFGFGIGGIDYDADVSL
ncbi:MAG: trans-2-enoyl-CoA reductase family protein [Puniceicoccales bacterium]|jgi:enoyl-[acyl-carrier protein] reductase/trans-2-enoyl-CoA reductase (NAD+)|nr:trans-2-enoyl-CoA reductase family protein [Puniceicoccales bacterium]